VCARVCVRACVRVCVCVCVCVCVFTHPQPKSDFVGPWNLGLDKQCVAQSVEAANKSDVGA
jgi:hypothetical protein